MEKDQIKYLLDDLKQAKHDNLDILDNERYLEQELARLIEKVERRLKKL